MTAVREQAPRTPPRFVVRTFWFLHRAAYRLTWGRLRPLPAGGRQQVRDAATHDHRASVRPVAGRDHRLLRGRPEPRHPGHERLGEKEPAWWLNLQARPETIVELPGETRAVRARAAAGEERDRLWAMFADYPGWGDDIDGLAARRSRQTAVVVLEPRTAATPV